MKSSVRLAGAATLCAALLLTGCAKKSTDATTSGSSTTTQSADATPAPASDATASTAPAAGASAAATTVTTSSGGAASGAYIELPVYPGATEAKDGGSVSASTNEGSVSMKAYSTSDDAKKVSEWYKAHLPAGFKNVIMTNDNKTVGTFVNEHTDGDQNVMVMSQDGTTTRIQLTTKRGK